MTAIRPSRFVRPAIFAGLLLALAAPFAGVAAPSEKEQKLIDTITSTAPKGERAVACKRLAVYGTDAAVPALAELLCDKDLASWARIPLEVIPGPVADEALRQEIPKVQGLLLVGVINSIGVRRDAKAVDALAGKLADPDAEVASAAADALGRIGGAAAIKALKPCLTSAPANVRPAVAEGCIRAAEQLMHGGKRTDAVALYDAVRAAQVPRAKLLEATRGAILARQAAGVDLLLAELRSPEKAHFNLGLRVARELPGPAVDKALGAELLKTEPERQAYLLMAIGDRGADGGVAAAVDALKHGSKSLQLAAINVLEKAGGARVAPALMASAGDSDKEISSASVTALVRLQGNDVDAAIQVCLESAQGKLCQAITEVASQRRLDAALPAISRRISDPDQGVRDASLRAFGAMGGSEQLATLVKLLGEASAAKDRPAIEAALLSIAGREPKACVPKLQPLAAGGESALRIVALHALAAAGGAEALGAVNSAAKDADESVSDEAVRTLSSWPNTWPEDGGVVAPLLAVARTDAKPSHKVLALRGYLEFVQNDKQLKPEDKPAKLSEIMPLLVRPEEKRLAIAVLRNCVNVPSLDLLAKFAADPGAADDAASAILDLTTKRGASRLAKDARQKALQAVAASTAGEAAKKSAADALLKLQ